MSRAGTPTPDLQVLSLFTGAGGLDVGLEAAGFTTAGCVEFDEDCRATLTANRPRWRQIDPGDILAIEPKDILAQIGAKSGELALVAGGPPCQPFSKASLWRSGEAPGMKDPKAETLRRYLRVIDEALPKAMLLENVKGISSVGRGRVKEEQALEFLDDRLAEINVRHGTNYQPLTLHLDAADYGVPQHRERVFVFAARDGCQLNKPDATHGPKATAPDSPRFTTAWDALAEIRVPDAGALNARGDWADLLPSIPEGKNYLWHTPRGGGEPLFGWRTKYWSFMLKLAKNRPSWTIQAQPGPATGPFHWESRRLAISEMAALQTFPAHYRIEGSYLSAQRQLGNAVPAALAELLGLRIRAEIFQSPLHDQLTLIPHQRDDCEEPEVHTVVPDRYLRLRAEHPDHPGIGAGPAAQRWKQERADRADQAA